MAPYALISEMNAAEFMGASMWRLRRTISIVLGIHRLMGHLVRQWTIRCEKFPSDSQAMCSYRLEIGLVDTWMDVRRVV